MDSRASLLPPNGFSRAFQSRKSVGGETVLASLYAVTTRLGIFSQTYPSVVFIHSEIENNALNSTDSQQQTTTYSFFNTSN